MIQAKPVFVVTWKHSMSANCLGPTVIEPLANDTTNIQNIP